MAFGKTRINRYSDASLIELVCEDFIDLALTPTTTITGFMEDDAPTSSPNMEAGRRSGSLEDLAMLVKNQGEQLAAQTEEVKKLKTENASLHRKIDAKCEDDKTLHSAQHGRVSNLERLVDSKLEGMAKEISDLCRLITDTIEATTKHVKITDVNISAVHGYINDQKISEKFEEFFKRSDEYARFKDVKGIHSQVADLKAEFCPLVRRDVETKEQLSALDSINDTLSRNQQAAVEDIATLEASVKDLGVELRMDILKIKEQLKRMGRSQDVALDGLKAELIRLHESTLTDEELGILDPEYIQANLSSLHEEVQGLCYERRMTDLDIEDLRKKVGCVECGQEAGPSRLDKLCTRVDSLEKSISAQAQNITSNYTAVKDVCDDAFREANARIQVLEDGREIFADMITAANGSVDKKLKAIDEEFRKVDVAFAEAGRQSREASKEIRLLKSRHAGEDNPVLTTLSNLKRRLHLLDEDAKTTRRAVEEQSQLIWSIDNKSLCSGENIEKKMVDAERRIASLEQKSTLGQSSNDTDSCRKELTDAEPVRTPPKGYKAPTVTDEETEPLAYKTPPVETQVQYGTAQEENKLPETSDSKHAPPISVIERMTGGDSETAARIQSQIEASYSKATPTTLRGEAPAFKSHVRMTRQALREYEASQEDLKGWVTRTWPDGTRMFGEWEVDDVDTMSGDKNKEWQ